MDKYSVYISPQAYREMDDIYRYIHDELLAEKASADIVDALEEAIMSLDESPYRGAERKIGYFANKGYRQLLVKNYTVVYRIEEDEKKVIIITVRYIPSNF